MKIDNFHPSRFVASDETTRNIQKRFVSYFPEGGRVADLGCGAGVFLQLLRESGRMPVGVEITESYVKELRERSFEVYQQDAFEFLRTHQEKFDGICASHFIEHFPAKEGIHLIELMYNALRPDGIIFLMTPAYNDFLVSSERFWLDISHVRPYPILLLDAVFTHLGIEVIQKGYDKKTRIHPSIIHPRSFVRYWIAKLRFGKYYDVGDAFIVGRKK